MSLQKKLDDELKQAMRDRAVEQLSTLRLLKSALVYLQIEKKADLSDPEFIGVVQKEIKKRKDSAEQFDSGSRPELADKERREVAFLEKFLPPALSMPELEQLVKETITRMGATSKKEMGTVIKNVQTQTLGRAEGKQISSIAARLLP